MSADMTIRKDQRMNGPIQLTLLCLVCALATVGLAAESRYMEAENLDMKGLRVHWNPEASYSGHGGMALTYVKIPEGTTRRPGELTLAKRFNKPLPPGDYRVEIRYHDAVPRLRLTLGETSVETELPAGDRHTVVPITTHKPSHKLTLRVLECGVRVIIDWIFICDDPRFEIAEDRRGKRLVNQTVEPNLPDEQDGNWIANASFEAGHPFELVAPYQHNLAFYSNMADPAHRVHGEHSLKVPIVDLPWRDHFFSGSEIQYGPAWLRKGRSYRFDAMLRSELAAEAVVSVASKELGTAARSTLKLGPEWRSLSLDVGPIQKPGPYTLTLRFEADELGHVWVDNLFFGSGDAFALREPVEAGPAWPRPANIMLPGEQGASLAVWREPGTVADARFEYQVYDWNDGRLTEAEIDLSSAPEGRSVRRLPLPTDVTGVYRLHFRTTVAGKPQSWRQVSYCVLPDVREQPDGPIGIYGSFAPQALQVYRLAGFRSTNTLSPSGHLATWNRVEPVFGEGYIFRDPDVDRACQHGIHVLCNINTQRSTVFPKGLPLRQGEPTEAEIGHAQGNFPVSAWKDFVGALAEHYRGRIHDYLIVDEPAYQYSPQEYFKLLKASSEAIKTADAKSRVWMHTHTVVKPEYLEVLDQLGAHRYCDGLYDYVRTRERGEALLAWSRKRNRPVGTVEYGGFATFHVDPAKGSIDEPVSLAARDNVAWSLESGLRSLAWARARRYYRYDARFTGHEGYMTMFERDGTLKPAGIALAVLNAKLAGLSPEGEVDAPNAVQAFLFLSKRRGLLAVRHADRGATVLSMPLDPALIEMTDCMGCPIEPHVESGQLCFVVDRQFRFVTFAAADRPAVETAFRTAYSEPAVDAKANLTRTPGRPQALRIELTNCTKREIRGFVCPERKSLFHFAGYVPIRQEADALRMRLKRPVHLAPGASIVVDYPLNYAQNESFADAFPGARLELNLESSTVVQILTAKLDALPSAAPATDK